MKRKLFFLLCFLLISASIPFNNQVFAEGNHLYMAASNDSSSSYSTTPVYMNTNLYYMAAQSFKPAFNGCLSSIKVRMKALFSEQNSADSCSISIWSLDSLGSPLAQIGTSQPVPTNSLTNIETWTTFEFSTSNTIYLNSGTKYCFVINHTGVVDSDDSIELAYSSNLYADGEWMMGLCDSTHTTFTNWFTYPTIDLAFRVIMQTTDNIDSDNDGVPNSIDNAPFVFNPDQRDTDGDGIGDVIDTDMASTVITISAPVNGATYALNQNVYAFWNASNYRTGIATTSATVENGKLIDTSTAGTKTFSVTAVDNAGNVTVKTITYNVIAANTPSSSIEFLQPLYKDKDKDEKEVDKDKGKGKEKDKDKGKDNDKDKEKSFKAGRTIPVKFRLKDAAGNYIKNAVAHIYYAPINNGIIGAEKEAVSTNNAGRENTLRYDLKSNHYIFNLSTKGWEPGEYRLSIRLNDGTSYTINITCK